MKPRKSIKSNLKPASITTSGKNTSTTKTLRIIDHTVRGAFITLSVTVLSLSFLGAAYSIFTANPSDYAKAQGVPTDPNIGTVPLPGSNPVTPQSPTITITSVTRVGTNLQVAFTKNSGAQVSGNHANFYYKLASGNSQKAVYDGASPYSVATNSVPSGATQVCVEVVGANNSAYANSGNCVTIPTSTTTGTNGGAPTIDTPTTPTAGGESIGVTSVGGETVSTTTDTTKVDPNAIQTQALNAAQTSGNTTRSGGSIAVVTGVLLLGIVAAYVYYKLRGDRKAILKMQEKKINLKK